MMPQDLPEDKMRNSTLDRVCPLQEHQLLNQPSTRQGGQAA